MLEIVIRIGFVIRVVYILNEVVQLSCKQIVLDQTEKEVTRG